MIQFKNIGIEDRVWLTSRLLQQNGRDCNLSFVNLFSWHFLTKSSYAIIDNVLIMLCCFHREGRVYMLPERQGDMSVLLQKLREHSEAEGYPLRIHGGYPPLSEWLDGEFPGKFRHHKNRDFFDYLYSRRELMELKGKDFQAKRNHVNRFKRSYQYRYEPLTRELIPKCIELEEKWCKKHDCEDEESLTLERIALTKALTHFEALSLLGGVLWVGDEIVAFTYGAPITQDTFGVHIEKANTEMDGAYNVINQEFARHIPEQYTYLNREEDLGLPGLRKAKLSYRPVMLLEKGFAEWVGE